VAEPLMTPVAAGTGVELGWTADAVRGLRVGRGAGLMRFGGNVSGDATVTGGSWPAVIAATA